MLTSKQRAYLRKLSNPLAVTLHIGKDGVTEGVISQLEVLLENHELVKGKVLENAMLTPKTVSETLEEAPGAAGEQSIGTNLVVSAQSSDPNTRRIVLEK